MRIDAFKCSCVVQANHTTIMILLTTFYMYISNICRVTEKRIEKEKNRIGHLMCEYSISMFENRVVLLVAAAATAT